MVPYDGMGASIGDVDLAGFVMDAVGEFISTGSIQLLPWKIVARNTGRSH